MKTLVCDPDRPGRFLSGALSSGDEAAFVAHLDGCAGCRAALEAAAGDAGSWRDARTLLAPPASPASPSPLGGAFPDGAANAPPVGDGELGDPNPLPEDLRFLAPADDPAHLGRIGGYHVTGLIGRGAMGAVFRALDPPLGRTVAVKVIDPALAADPATRARFAREAKAMAAVSHPHVVPVYAVDEHRVPRSEPLRTLPYFVMEYVPGETLAGRLARTGPLSVVAAVRVARQVALGLAAAHAQGLIHRDVKPANILLERGVERVRVADFGLARPADGGELTGLTRTGQTAGTPEYMAPEQVRGEPCDGRADLFALGAVLHASLTGHSPFRAATLYEALRRAVEETPPPLSEANPAVPAWLSAFCGKLLAKAPADRFASAGQVAGLLAAELNHLEHPGTPVPVRDYLPRRPAWRRRAAGTIAAAGVAAAGVAGVAVFAARGPEAVVVAPDEPVPALPSPKPRPRRASALETGKDAPDAADLDADLAAAAAAADRLTEPPAAPPPADAWRDDLTAARAEADRLLKTLEADAAAWEPRPSGSAPGDAVPARGAP